MNFMNPSQVKITTLPWGPNEERTLTKKQLDLLCGRGSLVRVVAPGPHQGSWVVTKVNQASIQLSSQVGPEGRLLPDQPADTKFTLKYDKFFELVEDVVPASFGSAVCNGWPGPARTRYKLSGPTTAMPEGGHGDKRPLLNVTVLERSIDAEPGDEWTEVDIDSANDLWTDSIVSLAVVKLGKPELKLIDPLEPSQAELLPAKINEKISPHLLATVGQGWLVRIGQILKCAVDGYSLPTIEVQQLLGLVQGLSMHKVTCPQAHSL